MGQQSQTGKKLLKQVKSHFVGSLYMYYKWKWDLTHFNKNLLVKDRAFTQHVKGM